MNNPLLHQRGIPRFQDIQPQHVSHAVDIILAEAESRLKALETSIIPTWEQSVLPMVEIERLLHDTWGPIEHLNSVKNSDELRKAYELAHPRIVEFSLRMGQSLPLFEALEAIRHGSLWEKLDTGKKRSIEQRRLNFLHSGIQLKGEEQKTFTTRSQRVSQLSSDFSNHVLDATKAFQLVLREKSEIEGLSSGLLTLLSESFRRVFPKETSHPETGPWLVTLDAPSFIPFMEFAQRRDLRETVYRAYITRASQGDWDNQPLMEEMLNLRKMIAQSLGYKNYSEMSLSQKMIGSTDRVFSFLEELREASWDKAQKEFVDLQNFAKASGFQETLRHWDMAFWVKRLEEKTFSYTDEELKPYFAIDSVLSGLFGLVKKIFGITVQAADGKEPVWHPDVRFYEIFDEQKKHIASFFLDPFSRPAEKRGGAWMNECVNRELSDDGGFIPPVAYLVCNFSPPTKDHPSLLTFDEVTTLFHEFGHGLQHMLTRVNDWDITGIHGIEWDAIEIASQFMENWCYHEPTLLGMARHYQTNEVLPKFYVEKLQASRTFRGASQMLRQIYFSLLDMELHTHYDPASSQGVLGVQKEVAQRTTILPPLPEDRFLCSFQHIFAGSYGAGYFSYKWAEVMSADAFSAFEEVGLDQEEKVVVMGHRYRETILALGGSVHPMDVFILFRGREPSTRPLLKSVLG